MSANHSVALREAHEELGRIMAEQEQSGLQKALAKLRALAGIEGEGETLEKSASNSETMPREGDQYPNGMGAEGRIAAARGKSTPGKPTDRAGGGGPYENLPEAEDDSTAYEGVEADCLDGAATGKPVTKKSLTDAEAFYKSLQEGDPTGELVGVIEATDALTYLSDTVAKSMAAQRSETATQIDVLAKSIGTLAEGLATIGAVVEELSKSRAAAPAATPEPAAEQPAAQEMDKSLSEAERKRAATFAHLDAQIQQSAPTFLRKSMGNLGKADEAADPLEGPLAKSLVANKLTAAMNNGQIATEDGANFLGMLDYRAPRDVVGAMTSALKAKLGF